LEPLLLAENKKKLLSSGLTDSLLARVRGVLLYLQQKGHPDLIMADVPRITNYWMKNTGASDAASRGGPEWLRNGQGRWGLLSQEPKLMMRKYIQSTLEEKLSMTYLRHRHSVVLGQDYLRPGTSFFRSAQQRF
jgi:hypothetical protein